MTDKKQAFAFPTLIKSANALTFVPNDTVDFSYLNILNGDVGVKIGNLVLPEKIVFKNVDVKAKLQNGVLDINPLSV